jgi:hypothetical protein
MKKFIIFLAILGAVVFFRKEAAPKPKIYDCFLFFNEFELLKIRLTEMAPYVDKFVLVEAKETFRGDPKPLYYAENQEFFKEWQDKIIHVVIEDRVAVKKPMHRERFQRNQIFRGLKDCKRNDIILISDVDEIVRRSDLSKITAPLISGKAKTVLCYQKMYTCFLNRYQSMWPGTTALTFRALQKQYKSSPTLVRRKRTKDHPYLVENVGWHFSYMGGIEQMLKKLAAFSHAEIDNPEHRQFFISQFQAQTPCEPIDSSFPVYVVENQFALKKHGWID